MALLILQVLVKNIFLSAISEKRQFYGMESSSYYLPYLEFAAAKLVNPTFEVQATE